MNIALLDDNNHFLYKLKDILKQRLQIFNIDNYNIDLFCHYDSINKSIDQYDVLFIDIEIGMDNGIDLSKQIRINNQSITIIFVSSYSTYVFDSFKVSPFSYILKDQIESEGVFEIDRYIKYYLNQNLMIELEEGGLSYKLNQRDIILIEKELNKCLFYYKKNIFTVIKSFKNLKPELADYFIQINKSEIVNFHFVDDIKKEMITLKDGKRCFISRRKVKEVYEQWIEFIKNHKD